MSSCLKSVNYLKVCVVCQAIDRLACRQIIENVESESIKRCKHYNAACNITI